MKKTLVAAAAVLFLFLALGKMWNAESTYIKEGVIVCINQDTITFKDDCNFYWEYYSTGEERVGQRLKATMKDQHTDSYIFDDEVMEVKLF